MDNLTSRQDASGAVVIEKKETELELTMRVLEKMLPANDPDKKELQKRLTFKKP